MVDKMIRYVKKHLLLLLSILALTLALVYIVFSKALIAEKDVRGNGVQIPTIIIPGSTSDQHSLDYMIDQLVAASEPHSVLKTRILEDGRIQYEGSYDSNDKRPYIIIAYENSDDTYENISNQTEWVGLAMSDLQEKYGFNEYNAIGYSNGGLNWTLYLENIGEVTHPTAKVLVTLGTPYNSYESDDSVKSDILNDMIMNKESLPKDLTVYNIAGASSLDYDLVVPLSSVLAGKYIFQGQVKSYSQFTVTGDQASHTSLPINDQIIELIVEKILQSQ